MVDRDFSLNKLNIEFNLDNYLLTNTNVSGSCTFPSISTRDEQQEKVDKYVNYKGNRSFSHQQRIPDFL